MNSCAARFTAVLGYSQLGATHRSHSIESEFTWNSNSVSPSYIKNMYRYRFCIIQWMTLVRNESKHVTLTCNVGNAVLLFPAVESTYWVNFILSSTSNNPPTDLQDNFNFISRLRFFIFNRYFIYQVSVYMKSLSNSIANVSAETAKSLISYVSYYRRKYWDYDGGFSHV